MLPVWTFTHQFLKKKKKERNTWLCIRITAYYCRITQKSSLQLRFYQQAVPDHTVYIIISLPYIFLKHGKAQIIIFRSWWISGIIVWSSMRNKYHHTHAPSTPTELWATSAYSGLVIKSHLISNWHRCAECSWWLAGLWCASRVLPNRWSIASQSIKWQSIGQEIWYSVLARHSGAGPTQGFNTITTVFYFQFSFF